MLPENLKQNVKHVKQSVPGCRAPRENFQHCYTTCDDGWKPFRNISSWVQGSPFWVSSTPEFIRSLIC